MRARNRQRGAALTELVVIVPVLVMIVYGSMYLTELGFFKLKTQEATRFAAWTMAVRPLSDFSDFNHGNVVDSSLRSARDELRGVYGDLDGGRDRVLQAGKSGEYMAAFYVPAQSDVVLRPTQLLPAPISPTRTMVLGTVSLASVIPQRLFRPRRPASCASSD